MVIMRGDIWWADLSPTQGSEQSGVRPVLVVQTDRANVASPHTIVVPLTTKIRQKLLRSHVVLNTGEGGTTQDAVILCEQIRVVDKRRLRTQMGSLTAERMDEVELALKAILDLS